MGDISWETLNAAAALVTIIGFPLALLSIWISAANAARERNLAIKLSLIDSFRTGWERGWGDLLDRLEAETGGSVDKMSKQDRDELLYILNWIDWLGCFLKDGSLKRPKLIFDALGRQIRRALALGRELVAEGEAAHGPAHWKGVRYVEKKLR